MAGNWLSSIIDPPEARARSLAAPSPPPDPPAQGRYGGPSALASPVTLIAFAVIGTFLVLGSGLAILLFVAISYAAGAR